MSRILIVEDDETLRGELSYFLIGNGYEVSVITDFKDTLDEMLKTDTELILLDLNLPGIDGQTLLRMYRKEKNTPVIIVTSTGPLRRTAAAPAWVPAAGEVPVAVGVRRHDMEPSGFAREQETDSRADVRRPDEATRLHADVRTDSPAAAAEPCTGAAADAAVRRAGHRVRSRIEGVSGTARHARPR